MALLCSVSNSLCIEQFTARNIGLALSPIPCSQSCVSELISRTVSSSLLISWLLVFRIQQTFNMWIRPPGKVLAGRAGEKWAISSWLDSATPLCWNSYQDELTLSSVSKSYPTAVICMFCAQNLFYLVHRLRFPCHIYKIMWTLANLKIVISATSLFISKWFSIFIPRNTGSAPAKFTLLAQANCIARVFGVASHVWLWLCPADNVSAQVQTRLQSDPMWYITEPGVYHIGEMS